MFGSARRFVVHCLDAPYDVYIGRPSKWGNPFRNSNKFLAVTTYRNWLCTERADLLRDAKTELRGKILGCWCKPGNICHGLVLAQIANEAEDD